MGLAEKTKYKVSLKQKDGEVAMKRQRWKILTLDVWAGESEGDWDINNWFLVGEVIANEEDSDDEVMIKALIELGNDNYKDILRTHSVDCHGDSCMQLLRDSDGRPELELQLVF